MKNIHHPISLFLFCLPLVITGFYAVAAVYYPKLYVIGTYEDLYGEWAQTYGFITTFIFSALIALNKQHPQRWFFLLLAIASFYVFMEEISWGQRLLGFDTPEYFSENSYQDEANIHNLLTGPVDTWTKTFLTYLVAFGLIAYGVFFPLLVDWSVKPVLYLLQWRIAAPPPKALMPFFILAAIFEIEFFDFNEAEVAELLVAWALAFTAFDSWLQSNTHWQKSVLPYVLLVLTASIVVWGTTTLLLAIPQQKAQIQSRLANGYEKFADRYEGYDYMFGAVEVLQYYNELRPNNTVILRRLADDLKEMGEIERSNQVLRQAVSEGLRRIAKDPENIQAIVSLAKSYRKLGDHNNMRFYADKAYDLALVKQQQEPDNAERAFWLAKACEQTNRQKEALKYYRLAHHLEPDSSRYEEAYLQMKEIMLNYED